MRRALAAIAALGVLAAAAPAAALPPVWVVTDKDSELVIFGSVHVLPPGLAWKPPALTRALARADDLWFELPVEPATEDESARLGQTLGVMAPDRSLFKMLGETDAAQLGRVAQTYGVDPGLLDRLQPWMAELALAGAAYRRDGAGTGEGVEKAIAAAAPRTARRRNFETPSEQLKMLAATPMSEQLASLRQTLDDMEQRPDEYRRLVAAWMAADLAALDREAIQPLKKVAPTLFQRLVADRNAAWAKTLDARLKGRGRTVVVVGVGHLVGEGSLPARLRALGYSVKGP